MFKILIVSVLLLGCTPAVTRDRLDKASAQIDQSTVGLKDWVRISALRQNELIDQENWSVRDKTDSKEGVTREVTKAEKCFDGLVRAQAQVDAAATEVRTSLW